MSAEENKCGAQNVVVRLNPFSRIVLLTIALTITGCVRPGDHPISSNCVWTEEDSHPLNLTNSADRHHLRGDATTAEDVAIRWSDKYFPHQADYEYRRDKCMEELFTGVASRHGVDVATVREYRLERNIVLDAAVILGFLVVYAVAAYFLIGRIRRRFPPGEPGFWIMTIAMSVGIAVVGAMVGNIWSIVIETYRLKSPHLSYRMNRIPWRQHWPVLLVCCFVVFLLIAAIPSRDRVTDK